MENTQFKRRVSKLTQEEIAQSETLLAKVKDLKINSGISYKFIADKSKISYSTFVNFTSGYYPLAKKHRISLTRFFEEREGK